MLHDAIPKGRFLPLPDHAGRSSAERRTGIEIEFAGLDLPAAAAVVRAQWGGEITETDPREIILEGGAHGRVKVELDISLKRKWAEDLTAQALGDLVPVEIVTAPLPQAELLHAEALVAALRTAGALGTRAKLAFGFGVHFNTELPGPEGEGLASVARAYALLENWLRASDPVDLARRVLPFVDPWPAELVDALADLASDDPQDLARIYARLAPSRHYGLDLLPALEHLCPDLLHDVPPEHLKGGRPTFHYRLPEARLDLPDWTLAYEWNRWCVVEHAATSPELMAALTEAWKMHRGALLPLRRNWAAEVEAIMQRAGLAERLEF